MENNKQEFIRGTFEIVNGELNFVCSTKGVSFEEVKQALTKLRDECQRQLDNETKCPFHNINSIEIKSNYK